MDGRIGWKNPEVNARTLLVRKKNQALFLLSRMKKKSKEKWEPKVRVIRGERGC